MPDATSLHPGAVTPTRDWRELCREACRDTQTNFGQLAIELEHDFESHVRQELVALTKSRKTLGVRTFYKTTIGGIFTTAKLFDILPEPPVLVRLGLEGGVALHLLPVPTGT